MNLRLTKFLQVGLVAVLAVAAAAALFYFLSTYAESRTAALQAEIEATASAGPALDAQPAVAPPTPSPSPTKIPEPATATPEPTTTDTPEAYDTAATITHVVQPGENLFRIAQDYGVSMEAILSANDIANAQLLFAGQSLTIPGAVALALTDQVEQSAGAPDVSATVTATASATSTATPTPPPPDSVNGVPIDSIVVMPEPVVENMRRIFTLGQSLGNNPNAFSKVGDSTIENPHFLARFDEGPYNLGDYAYLQQVIDHYAGSFGRQGMAVRRGFHSWTVTDPLWADKDNCQANETPIACEYRLHKPSVVFLRLGSNDVGVPGSFDFNMRQVVQFFLDNGVIPVIGTKADRFEGPGNINNDILRQIAADFELPLWDFDLVAGTIAGRGTYLNDIHLTTFYAHDYTLPEALQTGHGVHNLTALMVLDAILNQVVEPVDEPPAEPTS